MSVQQRTNGVGDLLIGRIMLAGVAMNVLNKVAQHRAQGIECSVID
jgi:hypothetical protein